MIENNTLKIFSYTNNSLNNLNTFLIDISTPVVKYLLEKNSGFDAAFRLACYSNSRFVSGTLEPDLFEKTTDFLSTLASISEFVGCNCHNKSCADFELDLAKPLQQYCLFLLNLVDQLDLTKQFMMSPDFYADYSIIKNNFLKKTIDLEQAQKELLYWQEAVSDSLIQAALVDLRYALIKSSLTSN